MRKAPIEIWNQCFGEGPVLFDGGMGTLLQAMGLEGGERPERWNLIHPDRVKNAYAAYINAGAQVITANTFGATRAHLGQEAAACMKEGVRLALEAVHEAGRGYVAVDMGSLGRLPKPYGDMPFEEAVKQFRDAFLVGLEAGGDLILIETMTDLLETRACTLAAREAMEAADRELPLLVSLTFDQRGRLLSGADIPGVVAMLEGLGVTAIGLNCGNEPAALLENAKVLLSHCHLPVFISPNASLPVVKDGQTVFPTTPQDFARDMLPFARLGARGLGGCCGTTPEHIRLLGQSLASFSPTPGEWLRPQESYSCWVSGSATAKEIGFRPLVIGERLNPTGKKRMKQALLDQDMDYLLREAIAQGEAGADVLDVNVGLPGMDEPSMLTAAVEAVQTVCDLPLQLDTGDPKALEAALRGYAGKPMINSVCGKQAVMDAVFPIAAKYGGAVVALCLNEEGIPPTVEGRLKIAENIIFEAAKYGISKSELLFDALTMTVATDPQAARITLETVRALHLRLQVKTVLGVSNVSFGLPQRPLLTSAFLASALEAGLDAAIMNPNDALAMGMFRASSALFARDEHFADYLGLYGKDSTPLTLNKASSLSSGGAAPVQADASLSPSSPQDGDPLFSAIIHGVPGDAAAAAIKMLGEGSEPLALIEHSVMPALSKVGERYEQGRLFLPQLLQSAGAAQAAFEPIRARLPEGKADPGKKVVVATVRGDVHDIGKNIVKVLLQNYGFTVIDLGKDVAPERVLSAVLEQEAKMVGLSALMTTTVPAMEATIALLHQEAPEVKIAVGGAVLNQEYAQQISADGYGKDAMATVRLCQAWSNQNERKKESV